MGESASSPDDLDDVLDSLTSISADDEDTPTRERDVTVRTPSVSQDEHEDVTEPPPIVRRVAVNPDEYTQRAEFPDLFAADSAAKPALTGLEGKVAYLRDKLKRREAQIARVKEAWFTRESELDAVETLWQREKERAREHQTAAEELKKFITQKGVELEQYQQKVTAAYEELERAEREARAQRDQALRELEELRTQSADESGRHHSLQQEILQLRERLAACESSLEDATSDLEGVRFELEAERLQASKREQELFAELEGVRSAAGNSATMQHALHEKVQELAQQLQQAEAALHAHQEVTNVLQGERQALQQERDALAEALERERQRPAPPPPPPPPPPAEGAPPANDTALKKATATLTLARRVLEEIDAGYEELVRTHGPDVAPAIGDAAAKIAKILGVTNQLLNAAKHHDG